MHRKSSNNRATTTTKFLLDLRLKPKSKLLAIRAQARRTHESESSIMIRLNHLILSTKLVLWRFSNPTPFSCINGHILPSHQRFLEFPNLILALEKFT